MAHRSGSPPSPNTSRRRRSSFTELFQKPANIVPPPPGSQPRPVYAPGTVPAGQQRRMSLNTLGLSGSPTQPSPFTPTPMRRGSVSSSVMSTSPTMEQAVVEETDEETPMATSPSSFARRVSFGAQALRNANGICHPSLRSEQVADIASTLQPYSQNIIANLPFSPQLGEGFNWPESLRLKAERAPSLGSFPPTSPTMTHPVSHHQRSASIATMEAPPPERVEPPKQSQSKSRPKPDYFQEKILRADFMD